MLAKERLAKEHFEPQPSRTACQYCPFMAPSPDSDLPQCKWAKDQGDREIMARNEEEANALLDQLIVTQERRKRIKDALNAYARLRGEIVNDSGEWYGYRPKEQVTWDPEVVLEVARREFDGQEVDHLITFLAKTFDLNKSSVDAFFDRLTGENKQLLEEEGKHVEQKTHLDRSF